MIEELFTAGSAAELRPPADRWNDGTMDPKHLVLEFFRSTPQSRVMRAADIQVIGSELAIKWEDSTESYISLERLRAECPCAGCKGETDVMGHVHKGPDQTVSASGVRMTRFSRVGGYGIQPVWGDGHGTGIYSFEYLKRLADGGES